MNILGVIGGSMLVLASLVAVSVAVRRQGASDMLAFLTDTDTHTEVAGSDGMEVGVATEDLDPILQRLLGPFARQLTGRIRNLYPSNRLDRIHTQLLQSGLSGSIRAEEFATLQLLVAGAGAVLGVAGYFVLPAPSIVRLAGAGMLIIASLMGPRAWLGGRVQDRTKRIQRDLPDTLDLLTISVEAGLGLEAAMATASSDLDSPLCEELGRTLQEMSLGLSRHQALDNLKNRTGSEDLKTFVVILSQADALGMPIGRVLRTQADEMRDRRRARAREQAAKLPVKILFPLMLFILPPLMILVLGPAAMGIVKMFSKVG